MMKNRFGKMVLGLGALALMAGLTSCSKKNTAAKKK